MLFPCLFPLFEEVEDRNVKDHSGEEDPDGEEGKGDIEYLADYVEPKHLSALHVLGQLLEVGVKTNAGERQHESPVLILIQDLVDGADLVSTENRLDQERGHERGYEESDDELRETLPDLAGVGARTM